MRISDGSSDVCSSDLDADIGKIGKILEQLDRKARQDQRADQKGEEAEALLQGPGVHAAARRRIEDKQAEAGDRTEQRDQFPRDALDRGRDGTHAEIGRAACRARVGQYVSISVVAGELKKKK